MVQEFLDFRDFTVGVGLVLGWRVWVLGGWFSDTLVMWWEDVLPGFYEVSGFWRFSMGRLMGGEGLE